MNGVIRYVDEVPSGLSSMLGELIGSRLAEHPARLKLLVGSKVGVRATDIGLSSTLYMEPGSVRVRNGLSKSTDIRLRADSSTLIALSEGGVVPGVGELRQVISAIRAGRLRIEGFPRGIPALLRFRRVLAR